MTPRPSSAARRLPARAARLFGLRDGEYARAGLMFGYLFFVLAGYYILKPVSRALFLNRFEPRMLPYLYLLTALAGGVAAYLYSRLAVRGSLRAAVHWSTGAVIASLVVLWLAIHPERGWTYYAFYIWVSLFSLVLVSQGWLLAGYLFTTREAKRLYGLLAAGGVLGAACGGSFTAVVVHQLGTQNLLLASAGFVLCAYACFRGLLRRPGVDLGRGRTGVAAEQTFELADVSRFVRRYRHLQVIVGIITLTYIADTLVEYQFSTMARAAHRGDHLTAFLGGFYGLYLNLATFVLQVLLTSAVINRFGVSGTLLVMPASIGAASAAMLLAPSIEAAGAVRIIEGSTRYSFNRTGMELLYLPLPPELKTRTKAFLDIFVDRAARGLGAGFILLVAWLAGDDLRLVAGLTVGFCALWTLLAVHARREYVATVRRRLDLRRLDLSELRAPVREAALIGMLEQAARGDNPRQARYALTLLEEAPGYRLEALLHELAAGAPAEVRAVLYELALRRRWPGLLRGAEAEFERGKGADPGALAPAVAYVFGLSANLEELLDRLLAHPSPQVAEAAIREAAARGLPLPEHFSGRRLAALACRVESPTAGVRLAGYLADPDPQVSAAAAESAGVLRRREHLPLLIGLLGGSATRRAAARALAACGVAAVEALRVALGAPGTPALVRLRIPRVLARIRHQAACDALLAHLDEPDLAVRAAVVRALRRQREECPQAAFAPASVSAQLRLEARAYAGQFGALEALRSVERPTPAVALLARTLEQRLEEAFERLFRLLGLRYPPQEIDAAWRACRRGRADEQANAVEFLDNILERDLKPVLLPLLDAPREPAMVREAFGLPAPNLAEALRSLLASGEYWLTACAAAAAGELGLAALRGDLEALAGQAGPTVEPVIGAALRRLAANGKNGPCAS